MPMSLDLRHELIWAWLIPGQDESQIVVTKAANVSRAEDGGGLLGHWLNVLKSQGVINPRTALSSEIKHLQLPLAGALEQEGVGNRTLLIGPAGGFYSACGEDVYPNCWSAVHAAAVLNKALKEKHLQDALNPYRSDWRATLGDYLRGPHKNLKFLLPLVYRNPVMTARITEAILLSKSVVR